MMSRHGPGHEHRQHGRLDRPEEITARGVGVHGMDDRRQGRREVLVVVEDTMTIMTRQC